MNIKTKPILFIKIFFFMCVTSLLVADNTTIYAQEKSDQSATISQMTETIYLPLINGGGTGGTGDKENVTPTATPTATPLVTVTPTPTLNSTPGPLSQPLPNADRGEIVHPQDGVCAPGTHAVHIRHGWPNFPAEDDEGQGFTDSDYRCEPDESLTDAQCSDHGTSVLVGGLAACQCDTGYAGATCNVCEAGYALNEATHSCEAVTPLPTVAVSGIEQSVEAGASTVFIAKGEANHPVTAVWTLGLPSDESQISAATAADFASTGCLFSLSGDQSCQESVQGYRVGYRAPETLPEGSEVQMVQVNINPLNNPNLGLTTQSVVIIGAGGIPITGHGDPRMQPVLNNVARYMRQRCIGAASLGISRYGYPLAVYGFGREAGRAAANWHDYCGDDESKPLAEPIDHKTPFRYGSANKPISFATLRYVLKERLADHDPDLAVTAITESRFVTAQRRHPGQVRLAVWDIDAKGELIAGDVDDFDLTNFGVENVVRDLALATLSNGNIVLAVRDHENRARFGLWTIQDNNGSQLAQLTTGTLGAAGFIQENVVDVELLALRANLIGANRFVIGIRTTHGGVHLYVLQQTDGDSVQLVGYLTHADARARMLSLADVSGATGSRLALGYADGAGKLALRTYDVPENGEMVQVGSAAAGITSALDLAAFGTNRLITGVRTAEGELKLISWKINGHGPITRLKDITADPVLDLDLTMVGLDQVMGIMRLTANGTLKLATWNLADDGGFTLIHEDSAGGVSALAVQALSGQRAAVAVRTQENFLKAIVWELDQGHLTRRGGATGLKNPDSVWKENDIERMRLTGFDLPELLMPTKVHAIYNGDVEPPVLLPAVTKDGVELCPALTQYAEPEWRQMTVGHILGHRTGLPKSAPGLTTRMENLHLLRNLNNQNAFAQQEAQLRAEFGNSTVDNGKNLLGYGGATVYVVPPSTIEETFILVAGRCLPYPVGKSKYSNTSASLSGFIVEHLVGRFAAKQGYPATHEGSGLDLFFANTLGIETSANRGAFNPQRVVNLPGYDHRTPRLRAWKESIASYDQFWYDGKRPHCVWTGNSCDFSDWLAAVESKIALQPHGALQWPWQTNQQLPFQFAGASSGAGASGNLGLEPGVFLRYLSSYWVNNHSYSSNDLDQTPSIGEPRDGVWNSFRTHNGAAGGTKGRAIQYGPVDMDRVHWDMPRTAQSGYLPITAADTFTKTKPGYFIAHSATGRIITYNPDGQPAGALDVGYAVGDVFVIGQNGFHRVPDSFYVARPATGVVDIYKPWTGEQRSYDIDFGAGDAFIVDDLSQSTIYDEVIVGDVSSGQVRVYPAWPIAINGNVPPIAVLNLNFAEGDKLGVGDVGGNGTHELYIARAATGQIDIYSASELLANGSGTPILSANVGYSAGDGFAVGNVIGTIDKDDIVLGRADSGMMEVYNYSSSDYQLYTSFFVQYQANRRLAVNDLGYGTILNEVLVSIPGIGAVVLKAAKNDDGDDYQFGLQMLFPGAESSISLEDDLAAGYWSGLHRTTCAYGATGIRQNLPDGVDLVFSINTSADKQCSEENSCDSYLGTIRMNMLNHGICRVNWNNVIPNP